MHEPCLVPARGWDAPSLGLFWKTLAGGADPPADPQLVCTSGFCDLAVACALPWVFSRVEPKHCSGKPGLFQAEERV